MQGGSDKSNWEVVKENGQEVTFLQRNDGTILKKSTGEESGCVYFVATQYFQENAISTLQGGDEAFFDIIFDGADIKDKLFFLTDSSGNQVFYNLIGEDQQYEAYVDKYLSKYWFVNSVKSKTDANFGKIELVDRNPPFNEYYLTKSQYGRQVWEGTLPGKHDQSISNISDIIPLTGPIAFGVGEGFYSANLEIQSDGLYNPQTAKVRIHL